MLLARAAFSSYVVLAAIWFLLSLMYAVLFFGLHRPGTQAGIIIPLVVGLMCVVWLRGFRLEIDRDSVRYRDGFYRAVSVGREHIREVKSAWVEWRLLTRVLRVPRVVISYGPDPNRLSMNVKPFRKQDIRRALQMLQTSGPAAR